MMERWNNSGTSFFFYRSICKPLILLCLNGLWNNGTSFFYKLKKNKNSKEKKEYRENHRSIVPQTIQPLILLHLKWNKLSFHHRSIIVPSSFHHRQDAVCEYHGEKIAVHLLRFSSGGGSVLEKPHTRHRRAAAIRGSIGSRRRRMRATRRPRRGTTHFLQACLQRSMRSWNGNMSRGASEHCNATANNCLNGILTG